MQEIALKVAWRRGEENANAQRFPKTSARLYDILTDPQQRRDLAEEDPDTVEKMFEEYALKDAG